MNLVLEPVLVPWKWSSSIRTRHSAHEVEGEQRGNVGGTLPPCRSETSSDSTASQAPVAAPGSRSDADLETEVRNGQSGGPGAVSEEGEVSSSHVVGRSAAPCPRCGSHEHRDVPIHDGASTRRDCARCHRFICFPVWYGRSLQWEEGKLCKQ
jgi:hypothetical protein